MKTSRGTSKWTVDWAGPPYGPQVGHVVRRFTPTSQDAGFYRVTAVREIRTRKPLPHPHTARYAVQATYIGHESRRSDWTLYTVRAPKLRSPERDRFSPLL